MNQICNHILMIEPAAFKFNSETATNNFYQNNNFKRYKRNTPSPVKTMPLTFVTLENKDIWIALAQERLEKQADFCYSEMAKKIEEDLLNNGASFFHEIQHRNGILKTQLEDGLADVHAA